jgi:hypothetical protein
MPQNQTYSNLYTIGFLATLGITTFGIYYFYSGMGKVSYRTYSGFETVTYYLDKQKYDLYFNGLIYCGCFALALLLLTAAILVPSQAQMQRRQSQTYPYGAQLSSAPMSQHVPAGPVPQQAPEGEANNSSEAGPTLELEPDFDFAVDDSLMGDLEGKS